MSDKSSASATEWDIDALTREPASRVDRFLASYLDEAGLAPGLDDAVRYALLGGGKRVRPALAWWWAFAVGGAGESSLPAGGGVELIHAFSLVHDDLPAMDDDDLRRGRPTLHVRSGEAMAILAGDAMLNLAFGALRRAAPETLPELLAELVAGTSGMIDGQVFDTLGGLDDSLGDEARLDAIHSRKTGALIRAACRMGAVTGAHSVGLSGREAEAAIERASVYGEVVGLMFQIVDDLLDVESTREQTGKRTGKDASAGKLTYPGVHGVDAARAEAERLARAAQSAISGFGERGEALGRLAAMLATRVR